MTDRHPADDELIAWALDDLPAGDRESVEAHVARCPQCRGLAAEIEAALHSYRDSRPREAPARILVDLLSTQARHVRGRTHRAPLRRLTPVLAAAAVLVVVFLTGFWMGSRSERPPLGRQETETEAGIRDPLPEPPSLNFQSTPPLEA